MSNYRRTRVPGGNYFFTLVAHDRRPVLANENVRAALRAAVQAVRDEHPFFVEAWVLLPDHLHCLWRLPEGDADYSCAGRRSSASPGISLACQPGRNCGNHVIGNIASATKAILHGTPITSIGTR